MNIQASLFSERADKEKTLTHHYCGEKTYLNDVHCPGCGEALQHERALFSAEKLMPEAIDALHQACPKAKVTYTQ
ncbi:hypothetical protein [Photobacterium nomapromontoriensis]|uniref:hypothetical protein n=1 Tax=Photobacterium nomapromontoriensis TaxID=2910237 RepID=UPI003D0CC5E1